MTDFQTFKFTIDTLEHAAYLIESAHQYQAQQNIYSLPWPCYEMALKYYNHNQKNYFYYLCRYVLSSLEPYAEFRPAKEDIENYRLQLLVQIKPVVFWLNGVEYEADWEKRYEMSLQVACI